ncbi:MAG: hypothetical protein K2X39_06775 [Silvanigrellaceae bacterium]|nr:hypothetical protein [Silvanigrellaceae bacterium]
MKTLIKKIKLLGLSALALVTFPALAQDTPTYFSNGYVFPVSISLGTQSNVVGSLPSHELSYLYLDLIPKNAMLIYNNLDIFFYSKPNKIVQTLNQEFGQFDKAWIKRIRISHPTPTAQFYIPKKPAQTTLYINPRMGPSRSITVTSELETILMTPNGFLVCQPVKACPKVSPILFNWSYGDYARPYQIIMP